MFQTSTNFPESCPTYSLRNFTIHTSPMFPLVIVGPVVHVKLVPSAGIQPDAETSTWQLHVHLLVLDLPGCSLSVFLEVEMISKQKFFHRF